VLHWYRLSAHEVKQFLKLKNLFKCPLVNETLWPETETRPRRLAFSPRRDRDLTTFCRDRDETETFEKYVSRPRRRDRDYNSATAAASWGKNNEQRILTVWTRFKITVDDWWLYFVVQILPAATATTTALVSVIKQM